MRHENNKTHLFSNFWKWFQIIAMIRRLDSFVLHSGARCRFSSGMCPTATWNSWTWEVERKICCQFWRLPSLLSLLCTALSWQTAQPSQSGSCSVLRCDMLGFWSAMKRWICFDMLWLFLEQVLNVVALPVHLSVLKLQPSASWVLTSASLKQNRSNFDRCVLQYL